MRYQSTTGFSSEQISEIVQRLHQVLTTASGPGRPAILGLYRQVLVVLILLRQNLSQSLVADMFGISQPTVSRIFTHLAPLLLKVIALVDLPPGEAFTGTVILVDGTDIPTRNRKGKRENYSGKRHRQGLNIQIASDLDGNLITVSDPVPGCRHDRRAIQEVGWEEHLNTTTWIADPAYIGTSAITPKKRSKHHELNEGDKALNKQISRLRSAVERCIAHLKNWKILATGYRYRLRDLPTTITLITKLEHYRNNQ